MEQQQRTLDLLVAYNCIEDDCTGNTYFFLRKTLKDFMRSGESIVQTEWLHVLEKLDRYNIKYEVSKYDTVDGGIIKVERVIVKLK
jgi:hypothetical protein